MFSKPYKLKSNNTLKNSEKKHLVQRIQDELPLATEAKAKELVPLKSNTSCMKLILYSGDTVGVYVVEGMPMIIEVADALVPTVCALWKVPDLVPMLTMQSLVLGKVATGVPLYVPGVVPALSGGGVAPFAVGAVVAARTTDNAAAALVGRAALSSADLLVRASGVCLETLHVYRDLLCKDTKFCRIERPELSAPIPHLSDAADSLAADIKQLTVHKPIKEEWPSLGKSKPSAVPAQNEPCLIPEVRPAEAASDLVDDSVELNDSSMEESQSPEAGAPPDMEGLLRWCLLSLMKRSGKSLELPLKTNLLYKNYLMPLCPTGRALDVKRSTYKKMGKFLEAMQQEGLLEIREIEKGVDAVVALHLSHPLVRSHTLSEVSPQPEAECDADRRELYEPPQVREMYCVTAAVSDLFAPHRKGTALTLAEVRTTVTEYVRSRNLTATQQKGSVVVDTLLAKILNKSEQEHVKWDEVMSGVQSRMTAATEMRFSDGSVSVTKARLEPVRMQVASRSGNKKVTLVSNLESFGFNLTSLAALCQVGVAASCGVTRSPGAKADQLMLQGDQTYFMAKLLIEKYGLPKKYVEGADKALKKKKCN